MAKKRKYRLKKKVKIILIIVFILCITIFGINRYKLYKYHQTDEYKLLTVGYSTEDIKTIQNILDKEKINALINEEKKDYIINIITSKYFMIKNFNKYVDYYQDNSNKSISDIIAIVNVGADKEWYSGTVITNITDDYSFLVNKFHFLPDNYEVENLKTFSSTYAYGTVKAEEECYNAFKKMADDAKKDNVTLVLSSGYRSNESQEKTYREIELMNGEEYADKHAARPGSSEHETGLALDILSNGKYIYTDTFEQSEAFSWLQNNAYKYGFILRYQKDKEYLTGYNYEAWHYRYLGVDLATKVYKEGITYDEYYAYYLEK